MPSIHKKFKSPYWYCGFRSADGRRLKRSTKLTDRKKALAWCTALQEAQDAISRGSPSEAALRTIISETMAKISGKGLVSPTIRSWFEGWVAAKEGTVAAETLQKYKNAVSDFLGFLGNRADARLENITEKDIVDYRKFQLARGTTASTINQHLTKNLSAPLRSAFERGLIDHNPTAGLKRLRDPSTARKEPFSMDEVRRLLAVASPEWRGMILAGYSTGMRLSDVTSLKWSDIDFGNKVIAFVQRKTGQGTVVGLHPDFEAWLEEQPNREGPIFPNMTGRGSSGRRGVSGEFAAIMKLAGIEPKAIRKKSGAGGRTVLAKSFHSFRHGASTHVFRSKVIEAAQKAVTGHSQGQVLKDVYAP